MEARLRRAEEVLHDHGAARAAPGGVGRGRGACRRRAAFGGRQAPPSFGGGLRPFRLPVFPGEKIKFSYLVHPARLLPMALVVEVMATAASPPRGMLAIPR